LNVGPKYHKAILQVEMGFVFAVYSGLEGVLKVVKVATLTKR